MKVESRTEHYWVDVETGLRYVSRLHAEIAALTREFKEHFNPVAPSQTIVMEMVAEYICKNYELQSLRDEDNPTKGSDEGHAG